ncbi:putative esterase [Sphingobium sp. SYK-6]|uniref:SGNH/GDSL hydrolase family protein n=1 Tax=Sphingobium sp. (strain NBRC 103272 / SYK-6) TaxID=627192 RepID=UPI0002277A80|nr:SGNH/GDSL hydrolase family protein [Sphingobium sp. SYK-6]BAK68139.1 putative esterase [Sphingobium sp. SYK-6]
MRWKAWIGLAALCLAGMSGPASAEWITSWAAAPLPPAPVMGPIPATPAFENRTLRQIVRLSAGGQAVRLRLTNAYGEKPLAIGAARVALLDAAGSEIAGTSRMLGFGGQKAATVPQGAPLLSDPVRLAVPALARMAITLYLPDATGPCTCHATGLDRLEISEPGDFSAAPFAPAQVGSVRAFLASVEVDAPQGAATVAVLGDSISDGVGSTPEKNRRWPDLLAERLAARDGATWGIANQGISGNRVLNGGMGESALARFDRDVLSLPGVKAVIIFEGVNDLGIGHARLEGTPPAFFTQFGGRGVTGEQIIEGYRQLIARAHGRGIRVYGATIAPYKGATYWSEAGEAERVKVNDWIRTSGAFDAVLDFDRALADPADPQRMAPGLHMGDFLHGSDEGYRRLAQSIDLALFGR